MHYWNLNVVLLKLDFFFCRHICCLYCIQQQYRRSKCKSISNIGFVNVKKDVFWVAFGGYTMGNTTYSISETPTWGLASRRRTHVEIHKRRKCVNQISCWFENVNAEFLSSHQSNWLLSNGGPLFSNSKFALMEKPHSKFNYHLVICQNGVRRR